MYKIPSQIYEKTAQKLCDAIGSDNYFAGTLEFACEDVECRMLLTVMVYHRKADESEGGHKMIDDIVPIWWEFHTLIDGVEQINDFDFKLLKEFVI